MLGSQVTNKQTGHDPLFLEPLGLAHTSGFLPQQRNSRSAFLAVHTDGKKMQRSHIFLTVCQCEVWILSSQLLCVLFC